MSGAKNVLICNERFLPRFGHDRSLVLLGRELAARGHHVGFACLRCERQVLAAISTEINEISLLNGVEFVTADRLAAEAVQAAWAHDRPDVLVTGGWPFFELAARSPAHGVRSLFIDPGAVPHEGYSEPMLSIQRELRRLRQRTLPFIDRILPYSDFIRDSQTLPDRGHGNGVSTVRLGADHLDMGFDPAGIDLNAEQGLLARLESLCRDGFPLILSLGRFEDEGYKNSPMVFDVFRMVATEIPHAHLLILAGPAAVAVPADLADYTICLPTLSDSTLQAVMRCCKLGLTLSLWEGFNLPLAEMQWTERPVLAFNLAAHPEVVADPWFLCASATEMARKAVRILRQDVPSALAVGERFERAREHLRWADTFALWAAEIETLTAGPTLGGHPNRRFVLMDVTYSGRDPANSGIPNVTRRLASELSKNRDLFLVFGIWAAGTYVLPSPWHRSFLESYSGPNDWLGRLIEQLGEDVPLERILEAADPRCTRPPVLFFPEAALDASAQQRVLWGRSKGFRVAFILYDLLPVYEAKYIDRAIVESFPHYLDAVLQADAIWSISPFTLREFERYCEERGAIPPRNREAVWLPGQFSDSPRRPGSSSYAEEIRILCVCTIEPRKNHRTLIKAFEKLRLRRPDLPLRLILVGVGYAGDEALLDWVREATRRDDRIEWRGAIPQTELQAEFTRATFSVYPSLAEGFGLPILESLWMGKPCICHEDGVMAQLAAAGGCITVDMKEPTELSIAMERLCSDPALFEVFWRQMATREIDTWPTYGDAIARRLEHL